MFDTSLMTLGQLEEFETMTGASLGDALATFTDAGDTLPPARVLMGLAWLASQHTPTPKTGDEVRNMTIGDLMEIIAEGDDVPPEA